MVTDKSRGYNDVKVLDLIGIKYKAYDLNTKQGIKKYNVSQSDKNRLCFKGTDIILQLMRPQ